MAYQMTDCLPKSNARPDKMFFQARHLNDHHKLTADTRVSVAVHSFQYRKPVSCSSEDVGVVPQRSVPLNARDYVESLHQNNKATLLYGKNNVHVQPVSIVHLYESMGQFGSSTVQREEFVSSQSKELKHVRYSTRHRRLYVSFLRRH